MHTFVWFGLQMDTVYTKKSSLFVQISAGNVASISGFLIYTRQYNSQGSFISIIYLFFMFYD